MLLGTFLAMVLAELALRAAGGRLRFMEERAQASAWWRQAPVRILCLGESTTAPTDRPDHSWPRQLEELLNERAGARRYAVINAGRSSTNSAVLLARLPGLLDEYEPRTVVAMMGVNDSKWYGVLEAAARRSGGWRGFVARLRLAKLARYVRYELLRKAASNAPHSLRAPGLAGECARTLDERACLRAVEVDPEDRGSYSVLVDLYAPGNDSPKGRSSCAWPQAARTTRIGPRCRWRRC